MSPTLIAFFIFAIMILGSSMFLLNAKKRSHIIGLLVCVFSSIAGMYILLSAETAATLQMLIYSGGLSLSIWFAVARQKDNHPVEASSGRVHVFLTTISILLFLAILFYGISDLSLSGGADLYKQVAGKVATGLGTYIIPLILLFFIVLTGWIGTRMFIKREPDKEGSDDA